MKLWKCTCIQQTKQQIHSRHNYMEKAHKEPRENAVITFMYPTTWTRRNPAKMPIILQYQTNCFLPMSTDPYTQKVWQPLKSVGAVLRIKTLCITKAQIYNQINPVSGLNQPSSFAAVHTSTDPDNAQSAHWWIWSKRATNAGRNISEGWSWFVFPLVPAPAISPPEKHMKIVASKSKRGCCLTFKNIIFV